MTRLAAGGSIDRSRPVGFRFDGVQYSGFAGDTLASALLANGVRTVARSVHLGRPRGVVSIGSEEPSAVVQVEAPYPEPMVTATTIELYDGLVASSIAGRGRLAATRDPYRYDAINAHCEVLVIGGGATGVQAALVAAAGGERRVLLVDERPGLVVDAPDNLRVLKRTTAFGYYDDNLVMAVERRTVHLGAAAPLDVARERLWRIRAGDVVLATGAHERPIVFAGNDRPGVMLAGAAAGYVTRFGVGPGRRAVVFTNNDTAYEAADLLREAGVEIVAIVDSRTNAPTLQGPPVLAGHVVVAVEGADRVESVLVAPRAGGPGERLSADLVAVSGGWNPAAQLFSQSGGTMAWAPGPATFVPDRSRQRVTVVGAAAGVGLPEVDPLWFVGDADPHLSFVDLQRDVTIADLRRAVGAGLESVEHIKRYTTAGTAHDQAKTSGLVASAVAAEALDRRVAELGTTTVRGPYTPVAFATLAGRSSGDLIDPIRITSMHDRHVALGARFENVGQWKRPWFYPQPGETMDTAVLRECTAARTGVACMDASTLGKIDVQGPDAAAFLDLLYTNLMSTLAVGAVRYGAMCGADGMIFDDGTVLRVADDRFVTTTTTGNAATVLDWMEEWRQTEWPHLRVWCTSVTEQWATVAVVGPRSRAVVAALAPGLAVDIESFPFMAWRDAEVAGLPARVARISFSGELAYELSVAWHHGPALWDAVLAAGRADGITPYGTETMHVLRAEKGYPIIGQDTDGTVTPQDLGMAWVVSKKKPDFIGKRSFQRAENGRTDRKQLVALLPLDPELRLREGTQLVATPELGATPVPMLGFVTSSYRSAYLGRTFALALVHGGRELIGTEVRAVVGDHTVAVQVVAPVLVDPEGARRDG